MRKISIFTPCYNEEANVRALYEAVKKEMEKYMPKSYIPDLIKIESLKEYMLIGCILLGLKEM